MADTVRSVTLGSAWRRADLFARQLWMVARCSRVPLVLHAGSQGWVCDAICRSLAANLPVPVCVAAGRRSLRLLRHKVIHFWEQFDWFGAPSLALHRDNVLMATWHHGHTFSRDQGWERAWDGFDRIMDYQSGLHRILCTNSIATEAIVRAGVPRAKIVTIPQGVDRSRFTPLEDARTRAAWRGAHGIPADAVVVGSFQLDSIRKGDQWLPKLEKGPDILVRALAKIQSAIPIHVVLTGPRRQYPAQELEKMSIPVIAPGKVPIDALPDWYRACDLCLVTSRDEGGPAAVLESMACGIPLVSTRVGMAADLVMHEENGMLCPQEDADAVADAAVRIARDPDLQRKLQQGGLACAARHDWSIMAGRYWTDLYEPCLNMPGSGA